MWLNGLSSHSTDPPIPSSPKTWVLQIELKVSILKTLASAAKLYPSQPQSKDPLCPVHWPHLIPSSSCLETLSSYRNP